MLIPPVAKIFSNQDYVSTFLPRTVSTLSQIQNENEGERQYDALVLAHLKPIFLTTHNYQKSCIYVLVMVCVQVLKQARIDL